MPRTTSARSRPTTWISSRGRRLSRSRSGARPTTARRPRRRWPRSGPTISRLVRGSSGMSTCSAKCIHVYRPDDPDHPRTFRKGQQADAEPVLPGWRLACPTSSPEMPAGPGVATSADGSRSQHAGRSPCDEPAGAVLHRPGLLSRRSWNGSSSGCGSTRAGRRRFPKRGDFVLREVAGESVIVVRGDRGEIDAFYNVCRHRGTRFARKSGSIRDPRSGVPITPGLTTWAAAWSVPRTWTGSTVSAGRLPALRAGGGRLGWD